MNSRFYLSINTLFDAQNDSSSHPLPSLFRLICGITMKRWWDGWRGNSLKKRAQGPSLTRTSSTSAEITSSSRYAGDDSEQCRISVVKSATNVHPSLTPTAHPKNTQYLDNDVVFFCFFSALFKPIQRSPWILLCTWPSTSQPHREPRWCVSCPLWRRRPPPSGEPGLSSLPGWLD